MKNLEIKDLKVGDKIQRSDKAVWEIVFTGNYTALARNEDGAETAFLDSMLKFYTKVPKKHVFYMNVYRVSDGSTYNGAHCASREEADEGAKWTEKFFTTKRIACLREEFEEGQFDD